MSSATEARYRIQAPNSKPRSISVIALDASSETILRRLARGAWCHAMFLTASANAGGWLSDLAGRSRDVMDEVDTADLVVMVATPGGHAEAASTIGEACSLKRVMTTALVVGARSASNEATSKTLAQVRPWSLMLVIASPDDYIDDMLVALQASRTDFGTSSGSRALDIAMHLLYLLRNRIAISAKQRRGAQR